MKNLFSLIFLFLSFSLFSQVVTSDPALPYDSDEVYLLFDVSQGSGNLEGYDGDVYVHTGVLTEESGNDNDWKHVLSDWGENTQETKLTRIGTDLYEYLITPDVREFYNLSEDETVTHLAFVLRSGVIVGDSYLECKDEDGGDIFVEVFEPGLQISITSPSDNLLLEKNSSVDFEAILSSEADISLYLDNDLIKTSTASEISNSFSFTESGDYWIKVFADNGEEQVADSVFIHILSDEIIDDLPEGMTEGFNETSANSGILVLYAPAKTNSFVLGSFNNFVPSGEYRMNRDGDYFWLELTGLIAGQEYPYQFLVDGDIKIADPYTEKVLDPWNDKWIAETTYPGLMEYPGQYTDGIVSVFQTQKDEYQWSGSEFEAPDQENLIIYELLLRDFVATHDWKTLTDTLNYFTSLGINAIELMPFNEFEGNESWGYNPSFYFAPDKYYGPANDLKEFIDSCHNRGIAVIMDIVFNHSYGQSPLVQLYWDSNLGQPSEDNPWYNTSSPNTDYSWGYDFNHESTDTKKFMDRVNAYWLEEYKIDGFRFDFTKGFTNTPGDGGSYDPSRIAILKRMSDAIRSVKPEAYIILEHFAVNSEEKVLSGYGMMLWGNHNYNYNEATMGWNEDGKSDFSWISYQKRTWADPNLVGYMESHDEERLMYKNLMYGNAFWEHDIQELSTALQRIELAACFFITIPGPKMIWQFGEMGYDYSIDYNDRVGNKAIRWDYYNSRPRIRQVFSKLNYLKLNEPAFSTSDFEMEVSDALKRIELNHEDMDVRIIGNFDVKWGKMSANFSETGLWYEYFTGEQLDVTDTQMDIGIDAGEYRIYTTKQLETPELPTEISEFQITGDLFTMFPNPVSENLQIEGEEIITGLSLFDISGKQVLSKEINAKNYKIDLSQLDNGLYILQITQNGTLLQSSKIIKN